jgi:hypothetical protein
MYLQKVIGKKTYFLLAPLKTTDENSRIRIRKSVIRIRGIGYVQDVTDPQDWTNELADLNMHLDVDLGD